jgi:hypothetical protein
LGRDYGDSDCSTREEVMLEFNAYKIFLEINLAYLYMPRLMLVVAV